jgi:DNA transposition AAA+ family ATPase
VTILKKIDQFLHASGMPPTVFGREAVHDPRLVGDLRNGREPRPETVARIETYIEAQEHRA